MLHVYIYLGRLIDIDEIDKKLDKMLRDPIHVRIRGFIVKLYFKIKQLL